MDFNEIS